MQRGLKVDGEVGPLVLNALVSGRAMVLGTHRRKTLVVCRSCHDVIHSGQPIPHLA